MLNQAQIRFAADWLAELADPDWREQIRQVIQQDLTLLESVTLRIAREPEGLLRDLLWRIPGFKWTGTELPMNTWIMLRDDGSIQFQADTMLDSQTVIA